MHSAQSGILAVALHAAGGEAPPSCWWLQMFSPLSVSSSLRLSPFWQMGSDGLELGYLKLDVVLASADDQPLFALVEQVDSSG